MPLSDYEFDEHAPLGSGGFGVTFKGRRTHDHQNVVIKKCRVVSPDDRLIARHEVEVLRGMDHPLIQKYYDSFEAGDYLHIVSRFATGRFGCFTLDDLARNHGPLPESEVIEDMRLLCCALSRTRSLYHPPRYIKPSNILLEPDGTIKLCDFGLGIPAGYCWESPDGLATAKIADYVREKGKLTKVLMKQGSTAPFRPPELTKEVREKDDCTTWGTDVWQLGATAYWLLTGEYPFGPDSPAGPWGEDLDARIRDAPPRPLLDGVASPGLKKLILSMLEKDPAKRPQVAEVQVSPFVTTGKVVIWRDPAHSAHNVEAWFEIREKFRDELVFVRAESKVDARSASAIDRSCGW
jgi:non-specific serine/threonine protein kinase